MAFSSKIQPDLMAAIDTYREGQSPIINRPAAIRRILTEYFSRHGFFAKQ